MYVEIKRVANQGLKSVSSPIPVFAGLADK
jgi:hypothetical protein